MTHSPIEIELLMDGKRPLAIRHIVLSLTIILMRAWYMPSMSMLTLNQTNPQRSTLLINFDYLPDVISELAISYLTAESHHGLAITDGENTEE
jgi:hypothetical protein